MLQNNNTLTCVGTAEIKGDCQGGKDGETKKGELDKGDETLSERERRFG